MFFFVLFFFVCFCFDLFELRLVLSSRFYFLRKKNHVKFSCCIMMYEAIGKLVAWHHNSIME